MANRICKIHIYCDSCLKMTTSTSEYENYIYIDFTLKSITIIDHVYTMLYRYFVYYEHDIDHFNMFLYAQRSFLKIN